LDKVCASRDDPAKIQSFKTTAARSSPSFRRAWRQDVYFVSMLFTLVCIDIRVRRTLHVSETIGLVSWGSLSRYRHMPTVRQGDFHRTFYERGFYESTLRGVDAATGDPRRDRDIRPCDRGFRRGDGNLYGTTTTGGPSNDGTVFELMPPAAGETAWTYAVLYSFYSQAGCIDGASPPAGLIVDKSGDLYGTASERGEGISCGTVFRLTPPATGETARSETVLHRFRGHKDGRQPQAGPIIGTDGNLCGTTSEGGGGCFGGCGTVFDVVR
jgi:uncharacterized repeat protein (TIGR03803 family)